jgi:tetratricopeptide (TPR) repeat protein
MIAPVLWITVLAITAGPSTADGERGVKDFAAANELALKGENESAIALYEALLEGGIAHEDLYLNLGNAYAESGREIDAIVAYERGLRLAPGDEDLRANLAFLRARLETKAKTAEAPEEGDVVLADAIDPFVSKLPLELFAYAAIAGSFVLFGALLFRRRAPAIAGLVLLLAGGAVVSGHFVLARDPRAVVIESADVKEGPHEKFKTKDRARAGARVRVLEEESAFVKILRQDGTSGWISARAITRV